MSAVNKMLDTVRESCSIASDGALAEALGVSRQLVSQWRKGANPLSDERIAQIAKLGRLDAGAWTVLVNAEQSKGEAKKSWASIVKRLGIASLLSLLVTFPALAYASSVGQTGTTATIDIMRNIRASTACCCFAHSPRPASESLAGGPYRCIECDQVVVCALQPEAVFG